MHKIILSLATQSVKMFGGVDLAYRIFHVLAYRFIVLTQRSQNRYSSSGTNLLNVLLQDLFNFLYMGVINPFFCFCSD